MREKIVAYSLDTPFAPWVFEYLLSAVAVALIVVMAVRSARAGEMSFPLLVTLSGMSMWWQEYLADWGVYLLYSPKFHLMRFCGAIPWTSPNKPWFMPFAYAWFYGAIYVSMVALVLMVQRKNPSWPPLVVVVLVAGPFFYVWDLLVEAISVGLGWWNYFDAVGPAIRFSGASAMPLLHPLLAFTVYGIITISILAWRDADDRPRIESMTKVARLPRGWRRECARLGVYVIVMNALFFLCMSVPLIAIRETWGHTNPYVP